ncbi:MAG: IPTL-CTERM sorting domain-containing protein [Deltaproteobacteria bacterium]|nr:IPTL-CTERM sorting domain-containing protein [Deltaproteobacteria bacterium]
MKNQKTKKWPLKASNGLNRKLIDYSMIAGAALAVAHPAEAAVQYSGIQNLNVSNSVETVDINGDGQIDFLFLNFHSAYSGTYNGYNYTYRYGENIMYPYKGNEFLYTLSTFTLSTTYQLPVVQIMENSQSAGPEANWNNFFGILGFDLYYNYTGYIYDLQVGKFNGRMGYIGVKFDIDGATHYGWIQFRGAANCSAGTIIDWAYEDQADTPIHILGPSLTIPTLNEWGIIILMGLILMEGARRLKKREQEN